jgi:hypothetical protein
MSANFVQQIFCDGCGAGGSLPVRLKYQYRSEWCDKCRHADRSEFAYYFCSPNCLARWIEKKTESSVMALTFPCRNCVDIATGKPTGYAFSFKENGPCQACNGKTSVG